MAWDADNPPEGFISVENAAKAQRNLVLKIASGSGLVLSIIGIIILKKRKKKLEVG